MNKGFGPEMEGGGGKERDYGAGVGNDILDSSVSLGELTARVKISKFVEDSIPVIVANISNPEEAAKVHDNLVKLSREILTTKRP